MKFILNQIILVIRSLFKFLLKLFERQIKNSCHVYLYFILTPLKGVEISECCTEHMAWLLWQEGPL